MKGLIPTIWIVVVIILFVYLIKVPGSATGPIKVATFYYQSLGALITTLQIPWPNLPAIQSVLHSTSALSSIAPAAIECVFVGISAVGKQAVFESVPLMLWLLALLVYLVGAGLSSLFPSCRKRAVSFDVFVYMVLSIALFVYFNVSITVLKVLSCTLYDEAASGLYVNAMPWIACSPSDPSFPALLGLAIPGLLFYVVGIPVWFIYLLYKHRNELNAAHVQRSYGFLYSCYRKERFWWEVVQQLRRVLLAFFLTIVPFTYASLGVVVVMVILVVSIALQHTMRPYATKLENRLELLVLYTLLISYIGAYVAQQSTVVAASAPLSWVPVVLLVLNVVVALILLAAIALIFIHLAITQVEWVGRLFSRSKRGRRVSERLRKALMSTGGADEGDVGSSVQMEMSRVSQ